MELNGKIRAVTAVQIIKTKNTAPFLDLLALGGGHLGVPSRSTLLTAGMPLTAKNVDVRNLQTVH